MAACGRRVTPDAPGTDLRRGAGRLDRRTGGGTSDPRIIYVGTGEADMRSDIAQGAGLFRSTTSGVPGKRSGWRFAADRPHPGRSAHPDVVLVAAFGHPYGANGMRGVFRSTDGGKTWQRTLYSDADTGAIDLAAEPGRPEVSTPRCGRHAGRPGMSTRRRTGPAAGSTRRRTAGKLDRPAGHGLPDVPAASGSPSHPRCRSESSRSSTRPTAGSTAPTTAAELERVSDDRASGSAAGISAVSPSTRAMQT